MKADCVVCYWLDSGLLWIETSWSIFTFLKVVVLPSLPAAAQGTCSKFTYMCKNQVCINKLNAECDRINDCSDNSDEAACGRNIFTLSKAAEGGSNIVTVTQTDSKRAAHWAVCWKRAPGLDSFIYFIFLSAALVISEVFVFNSI